MVASPMRTSKRFAPLTGLAPNPAPVRGAIGVGEAGPGVRSPTTVLTSVGVFVGVAVEGTGVGVFVGVGVRVGVGVGVVTGLQAGHGGSNVTRRFVKVMAVAERMPGATFDRLAGPTGLKPGEPALTGFSETM